MHGGYIECLETHWSLPDMVRIRTVRSHHRWKKPGFQVKYYQKRSNYLLIISPEDVGKLSSKHVTLYAFVKIKYKQF